MWAPLIRGGWVKFTEHAFSMKWTQFYLTVRFDNEIMILNTNISFSNFNFKKCLWLVAYNPVLNSIENNWEALNIKKLKKFQEYQIKK